jgi:hypothetical protein
MDRFFLKKRKEEGFTLKLPTLETARLDLEGILASGHGNASAKP